MHSIKVASRFMLPVEMLIGWMLLVVGLVGSVGGGTLYRALLERGENLAWGLPFCAVGALQVAVSMVEWWTMRGAPERDIMLAANIRSALAFIAGIAWLAAFSWVIVEGLARTSMMLVMTAPIVCAFNAWAFIENQKVKYALDPKHPTTLLQFHR